MHREYYRNGILERIDMFRNPENHSQEEVEALRKAVNFGLADLDETKEEEDK